MNGLTTPTEAAAEPAICAGCGDAWESAWPVNDVVVAFKDGRPTWVCFRCDGMLKDGAEPFMGVIHEGETRC